MSSSLAPKQSLLRQLAPLIVALVVGLVFVTPLGGIISNAIGAFLAEFERVLMGDPQARARLDALPDPLLMLLIAITTHTSEDLTCLASGFLAAHGVLSYLEAFVACFLGIVVGDYLLYLAGYYYGRPAIDHAPLKWVLSRERVAQAERLFQKRGGILILVTRFIPGTRAPTYFAAGLARAGFWKFLGWFLLAAALWTPLIVGAGKLFGKSLILAYNHYSEWVPLVILCIGVSIYLLLYWFLPALTWKGRRLLLSRWRRWTKWEFWPLPLFNIPIFLYVCYLAFFRYRSPTLLAAANPGMPMGGFIGESKSAILGALAGAGNAIARWKLIPNGTAQERMESLSLFLAENALSYPIVLKPDEGQRGLAVKVIQNEASALAYFESAPFPLIAQEFIGGREFGVFYARHPDWPNGKIISITDKRLISVKGDGLHTLEELILRDSRAVCMAPRFLKVHADRLAIVPKSGENVPLVELGTHARGALFLNAESLLTPDLENAIDALAKNYRGFHFGRFDLRVPDVESLKQGRGIKVLELNGITSESTHIYDPKNSLFYAWKTLMRQWQLCFSIAYANARNGVAVPSVFEFLREWHRADKRQATMELS